jgi:hypothetical protein
VGQFLPESTLFDACKPHYEGDPGFEIGDEGVGGRLHPYGADAGSFFYDRLATRSSSPLILLVLLVLWLSLFSLGFPFAAG